MFEYVSDASLIFRLRNHPTVPAIFHFLTQIQGCLVHRARNSLRYVLWKNRKAVADDLKPIY